MEHFNQLFSNLITEVEEVMAAEGTKTRKRVTKKRVSHLELALFHLLLDQTFG